MKKAIAKYWNRTYGFMVGVICTLSGIATLAIMVAMCIAGTKAAEKEKDETEED